MVSTINLQMNSFFIEDFSDTSDSSTCPSPITHFSGCGTYPSEEKSSSKPVEDKSSNEPKHTYATLIAQAIMSTPEQKTLLQDIYSYITTNYEYYRTCSKQWQNSIRHNLSLHKAFCKLPRQKGTPGKGNFWTLTDEYKKFYIDGELHIPKGYELVKEGAKNKSKSKVTKALLRNQAVPYFKPTDQSLLSSVGSKGYHSVVFNKPKTNQEFPPTPNSTPDGLCYGLRDSLSPLVKMAAATDYQEHPFFAQPVFADLNLYNMDVYQQLYSSTLTPSALYQSMLYSDYPEMKCLPSEMGIAPELLMGPNPGYIQTTEPFEVDGFLTFE